jgi:hypothetical protein
VNLSERPPAVPAGGREKYLIPLRFSDVMGPAAGPTV